MADFLYNHQVYIEPGSFKKMVFHVRPSQSGIPYNCVFSFHICGFNLPVLGYYIFSQFH